MYHPHAGIIIAVPAAAEDPGVAQVRKQLEGKITELESTIAEMNERNFNLHVLLKEKEVLATEEERYSILAGTGQGKEVLGAVHKKNSIPMGPSQDKEFFQARSGPPVKHTSSSLWLRNLGMGGSSHLQHATKARMVDSPLEMIVHKNRGPAHDK